DRHEDAVRLEGDRPPGTVDAREAQTLRWGADLPGVVERADRAFGVAEDLHHRALWLPARVGSIAMGVLDLEAHVAHEVDPVDAAVEERAPSRGRRLVPPVAGPLELARVHRDDPNLSHGPTLDQLA